MPSVFTRSLTETFQNLQLRSDIQIYLTCTGLPPSPARCCVLLYPTVFVSVFHILLLYATILKSVKGFYLIFHVSSVFYLLLLSSPAYQYNDQADDQDHQCHTSSGDHILFRSRFPGIFLLAKRPCCFCFLHEIRPDALCA